MSDAVERTNFKVAIYNPFWRYAVACLERPDIAAIPFWSGAQALVLAGKAKAAFPHHTMVVLHRLRWDRVEVIKTL